MIIPDAVQGGTHTPRSFTWLRGDGTAQDLTGAALSATKENILTGVITALTGPFNLTDAPNGVFEWVQDPADTAEAGGFRVQFTATYSALDVEISLIGLWRVFPKQTVTP